MNKEKEDRENRYCDEDEIWVCQACGKWVPNDRYDFDDAACMLNALKVKAGRCKASPSGDRITEIH